MADVRPSFDRSQFAARLQLLAAENIFIGTSSWKYEGWLGQLYTSARYEYRGKVAKTRFEAGCLEEYAETFPTVCVDAGYYRFPDERYIGKLIGQVPPRFKLSFKATDEVTIKNFPNQPRHGDRAGKSNENFLNAQLFTDAFLAPMEAYRENIGVLMFEFSRFHSKDFERGRDFLEALDRFLGQLPKSGWQYGVEIRNPAFLQPEYFAMLASHSVTHVFNAWTQMPEIHEQMAIDGSFTTDFFAARFLLRRGRAYQTAVDSFSPYREIQDPNPDGRIAMRELTRKRTRRPSYIFVNNRFEGNALDTIAAVLDDEEARERWKEQRGL
jgi:uncharacterized protein YecE (DUF72 family)